MVTCRVIATAKYDFGALIDGFSDTVSYDPCDACCTVPFVHGIYIALIRKRRAHKQANDLLETSSEYFNVRCLGKAAEC
jgi:hypothetical protein